MSLADVPQSFLCIFLSPKPEFVEIFPQSVCICTVPVNQRYYGLGFIQRPPSTIASHTEYK